MARTSRWWPPAAWPASLPINTDVIDVVDSQLILDGLRIIYERYKREQK